MKKIFSARHGAHITVRTREETAERNALELQQQQERMLREAGFTPATVLAAELQQQERMLRKALEADAGLDLAKHIAEVERLAHPARVLQAALAHQEELRRQLQAAQEPPGLGNLGPLTVDVSALPHFHFHRDHIRFAEDEERARIRVREQHKREKRASANPAPEPEPPPASGAPDGILPTDPAEKRAKLLEWFRDAGGKRPDEPGKKRTRGALTRVVEKSGIDKDTLGAMLDKAIEEKRGADAFAQLTAKR